MEVAAGKVKSKPVTLEHGVADVVQWTLATAAANKLNVIRSFAHGVDSTFPLQIKAGQQNIKPVLDCKVHVQMCIRFVAEVLISAHADTQLKTTHMNKHVMHCTTGCHVTQSTASNW